MSYEINNYPDGTSYINNVTTKPVTFKLNCYEDLWHLNQYVDAFISQFGFEPNITIPNLIDAQADRRFNQGESSGLKLVCNFLNSLKVKKYYIFHPHNAEVVEALIDNVEIIDNSSFISRDSSGVLGKLLVKFDGYSSETTEDNLILMSSDAGGFKPLMKLCDKIDWSGGIYSASKSRKLVPISENSVLMKSKITQLIDRQDFKGKDILIVDDISVFGGTFKGLSKLLRERNCGKLYLAVSHITMQNLGNDSVTNYFDKVFTTNSKFDNYYKEDGKKPFNKCYQPENLEIIELF